MCVIGNPIKQSKSPWIHQQFAKQFALEIEYSTLEINKADFKKTINEFKNQQAIGLNITVPFKEEAFLLADEVSERARIAKAVNTFLFKKNGAIFGDNTDGIGLVKDLQQNLSYTLENKNILILGAGGAVRGLLYPLLQASPKSITLSNRTLNKAIELAVEFKEQGSLQVCSLQEINKKQFDLIIEGTSAMNFFEQLTDIFDLSAVSMVYDLKYQSLATPFLDWAKKQGAQVVSNGIGMLIEQAAYAFQLWTGKYPDTRPVLRLIKENFPPLSRVTFL